MRRRQPKHRAPKHRPSKHRGEPHRPRAGNAAAATAVVLALSALPQLALTAPAQAALPAAVTAAYPQRTARIDITLVTLQTRDKTAADAAALDVNAYQQAVQSASAYWSTVSSGRITFSMGRVLQGQKTAASSGDDFSVIMNTVAQEIGWTPGASRVLMLAIPRDDVVVYGSGGNLGAGWEAGPTSGRILLPKPSGFTSPVTAHELGHVLGLGHANTLQCSNGTQDAARRTAGFSDPSCTTREYGDRTDLMGVSQWSQPYLNSYLFEYGGFGNGDEVINAGTAGQAASFTLWPWAGSGPRRAMKFKDPATGEWYYLQYKAPVGYDALAATGGNRGVEILKGGLDESESLLIPPSTLPFPGYYATNLAWQPGQTFTTAGGTRVRIDAVGSSTATVTITATSAAAPDVPALLDAKAAERGLGPKYGGVGSTRDGGFFQMYQGGAVVWSPMTGAFESTGAIREAWQRFGFEDGPMGYPTSSETGGLKDGGIYQMYQGGAIIWSPSTGARQSTGPIREAWQRLALENGRLGYPTTDEVGGLKDGGKYQMYQGGAIIWSPATGAFESTGAIRGAWQRLGFENGSLGYPTTSEVGGLKDGGVYQMYQGGAIIWSPATGAFESAGPLRAVWQRLGFENGRLGYPTSPEVTGLKGGGTSQSYQGGDIVWSPATGAFESVGAIRGVWQRLGAEGGRMGYPTSPELTGLTGGGVSQTYQGGAIVWSPMYGAFESVGAIRSAWLGLGGEAGRMGYPTSSELTGLKNGGVYQTYQGGVMVWSPATGAHESVGGIRNVWGSLGFENGRLGYPTSGEYAIPGGVAQDYQGGRIEWTPGSGTRVIDGVQPAGGQVTPIPPASNGTETAVQIQAMVRQTAVQMGVDPALALAVAEQESGFRQNVTSSVGAIGVMQIMPANRDWLAGLSGRPNLDLQNTSDNIAAGVALLRWLQSQAKSLDEAIAGYYQGLYSVQTRGMYEDTKRYVAQVKDRIAKFS